MDPQGRRPGSAGSIPEQRLVIEPIEYRENIFRGYLGSLNQQVFFVFCNRKQGNYQLLNYSFYLWTENLFLHYNTV